MVFISFKEGHLDEDLSHERPSKEIESMISKALTKFEASVENSSEPERFGNYWPNIPYILYQIAMVRFCLILPYVTPRPCCIQSETDLLCGAPSSSRSTRQLHNPLA